MAKTAIVIGAGIAGLAMARALAEKNFRVTVLEKTAFASGASVRNFGMVWPIGQPDGEAYELALRSRSIWQQMGEAGVCWHACAGSLHLAYSADEWAVLQELEAQFSTHRPVSLLSPAETGILSEAVVQPGLAGALFSRDELLVDPREAIAQIPEYLQHRYNVEFSWGSYANYINEGTVYIGGNEIMEADLVVICSGADLEILYPGEFARLPLTRCKLQMMRLAGQPGGWQLGPALCGALSLLHYASFRNAPSLPILQNRLQQELPEYLEWGIHVMAAQNGSGEITIGDSHEYGVDFDPFNKMNINQLILKYLYGFMRPANTTVSEYWWGVYPKLTNGDTCIFFSPEPGVYAFNGLGGAGMTLAFALAEKMVETL